MKNQINRKAFWAGTILFTTAFFWGLSFIFQRMAVGVFTPVTYVGLRFTFGALLLVPLAWPCLVRRVRSSPNPAGARKIHFWGILASGGMVCVGSALQQYGIVWTSIANAGFITSLYVVLVPLILFVFGRRITIGETFGAVLAAIGLFLLSLNESFGLSFGDALVLIGAFIWAFHVIYLGWASQRMDAFALGAGQSLVCGVISLIYVAAAGELPGLTAILAEWRLILGGSVLSVTLGFTLQIIGQRDASPAAAAIILQLEAVFAALSGWVFLGEGMTPRMIAGAAIMLAGVLVSQLWVGKSISSAKAEEKSALPESST
jgi:drug/metabolite transporter (DMT)-like permease